MQTTVLAIDSPENFAAAVGAAAEVLRAGGIAALPTETVYGLAANALDAGAVGKIYEAKGRPASNPIIVHAASLAMARGAAADWPEEAALLARHFWPGPLTLVLPRAPNIPAIVAADGPTVGIRWPRHPFMQRVIAECGFPLAAPSANLANQISPTTAGHVRQSLEGRVPLIVDAGPSSVGIESTVLDLTMRPPRLLRPGMISAAQIEKVLGKLIARGTGEAGALKSPGLFRKHYSPKAKLRIAEWADEAALLGLAQSSGVLLPRIHVLAHQAVPLANPFGRVAIIPHDPEAYARALYSELHWCDELGAELILAEALPEDAAWEGIRDRLTRAAAEN